ncbi:ABC transporter permease subunit [Gallaecimonas kandeliae]|uniref:ABC transporter permease subunit n=1 Tax=Gallaecimonas kandeliae TaxID=3029055 RepID=UPI002647AA7A|nr:ABC transporter permease subunit [Gallaecimonas kandeliae]WKE64701.1 ABC transporter permease subunit [Gallaecimonas kandeliae]
MAQAQSLHLAANRRRLVKDRLTQYGVTLGGVMVLVALLLIFFYLLYVVAPLFKGAKVEEKANWPAGQGASLALGLDEQNAVGYRISADGQVHFFAVQGKDAGKALADIKLDGPISALAAALPAQQSYALVQGGDSVVIIKPDFKVIYGDQGRKVVPALSYPLGEALRAVVPAGHGVQALGFEYGKDGALILALDDAGKLWLNRLDAQENFLTGETDWQQSQVELPTDGHKPSLLKVNANLRQAYALVGDKLLVYDLSQPDDPKLAQVLTVAGSGEKITAFTLLSGSSSLLLGSDQGKISQWFEVVGDEGRHFAHIRDFDLGQPVAALAAEYNRKGFVAAGSRGNVTLFHATSEARLASFDGQRPIQMLAYAPRANGLLAVDAQQLHFYKVVNPHPEVSWKALWEKVWYEGYAKPDYVWQSSSGSDDFEPKLSLMPLAFGTLKAAFYAMLFATPLALAGAIYTAYFMSDGMRRFIKPTVEIMEALPTVILGFLAGLWLAPLVEDHLPGIVALLLVLPLTMLLAAFGWHQLPEPVRHKVPDGWQALLLVLPLLLVGYGTMALSPLLEQWWFGGDTRLYFTNVLGINFDQRNSLVVGIAMGFAVIPTIFTIAEDAIYSVPKHLSQGSLALGATSWQTLTRVVLLTASPGIFSAVMMGVGRAVGETMIVLMATGNTPIMDWNIFEGMRTLAANIAVEMGESEVASSHYRVLFLAAFVLFLFTFLFNTVAEFVRQRLREKYSSL